MDEDPKQHDFDQRHDGPLQDNPIHLPRRHHSDLHAPTGTTSSASPSGQTSHVTRGRMSVDAHRTDKPQWATEDEGRSPISPPGRKSTQMSRGGGGRRPSEDFDRRFDGPFGRPSLTMSRRRSSGNVMSPISGHRPSEPAVPIPEDRGSHEMSDVLPPSVDTLVAEQPVFEPEPPSLNYTLHTRKWAITFFWIIVIFDSVVMPLALYYGLWYGLHVKGKMSANTVFSIVTAALGGISIGEYFLRLWRLWKKNSTCRVIGARRMYLDWFHWNFTIGWVIIMVELIVGTVPENPPIRLVAMPCPSMLYVFGTELLIIDFMRYFQMPAPCRISSIPKGAQLRPGIYSMIEDIVAVDGSGGTDYREALNKRYEASHTFRAMLRRLGLFWSIGAQAMAVLSTILVFTLQRDAAYAVGWAAPFIWAGVWTLCTFWYVKKMLRQEKTAWRAEAQEKIEEGLRQAS